MSITAERDRLATALAQVREANTKLQARLEQALAERGRLAKELELRRKVMVDIPTRCTSCGCDWDYTAAEAAKEASD